uniref:Putative secreted peptide n=1 Tax=Anopheles braziliensis TaxID=58242 RepID=A0A2M3ZNI7_9DIPT
MPAFVCVCVCVVASLGVIHRVCTRTSSPAACWLVAAGRLFQSNLLLSGPVHPSHDRVPARPSPNVWLKGVHARAWYASLSLHPWESCLRGSSSCSFLPLKSNRLLIGCLYSRCSSVSALVVCTHRQINSRTHHVL